jgi:hypothetical protein
VGVGVTVGLGVGVGVGVGSPEGVGVGVSFGTPESTHAVAPGTQSSAKAAVCAPRVSPAVTPITAQR